MEDWESKVVKLEDEYGETMSDNIKVAILIPTTPDNIQEKSFDIEKRTAVIEYANAKMLRSIEQAG